MLSQHPPSSRPRRGFLTILLNLAGALAILAGGVMLWRGYVFGASYVGPSGDIGRIPPLIWAGSAVMGALGLTAGLISLAVGKILRAQRAAALAQPPSPNSERRS